MLVAETVARPTHLDEIFCQEPNHLGLYDTPGICAGGVWIDPYRSVSRIVWRHPWSPDIIAALVLDKNTGGTLTNSDLELFALVLHKATLLSVYPDANMAAPPPRIG